MLTVFAKAFISDASLGFEYTSTIYIIINVVNMADQLSSDNVLETKKNKTTIRMKFRPVFVIPTASRFSCFHLKDILSSSFSSVNYPTAFCSFNILVDTFHLYLL